MLTTAWLIGALELAVKTFATTLLSLLGAGTLNLLQVAWPAVLGTAGGAALLSILMSVMSAPVGGRGTNFVFRGGR